MNNALATAAQAVQHNALLGAVAFQGAEHLLRQGVSEWTLLRGGRHDVVDGGNSPFRTAHRQALVLQRGEGLGAGDFMDQMQTHEQLCGSTGEVRHPMQIPHLVVEGAGTQQSLCAEG